MEHVEKALERGLSLTEKPQRADHSRVDSRHTRKTIECSEVVDSQHVRNTYKLLHSKSEDRVAPVPQPQITLT